MKYWREYVGLKSKQTLSPNLLEINKVIDILDDCFECTSDVFPFGKQPLKSVPAFSEDKPAGKLFAHYLTKAMSSRFIRSQTIRSLFITILFIISNKILLNTRNMIALNQYLIS